MKENRFSHEIKTNFHNFFWGIVKKMPDITFNASHEMLEVIEFVKVFVTVISIRNY